MANPLHVALEDFTATYATKDVARAHLTHYPRQREVGRANLKEVIRHADAGEDVTGLVLLKLLPHMNSPHNRERGAWIHIAPAITRDIQKWFERAGWVRREDWPQVAAA